MQGADLTQVDGTPDVSGQLFIGFGGVGHGVRVLFVELVEVGERGEEMAVGGGKIHV